MDLTDLHRRQAGKHISQIKLRIDAAATTADNNRIDNGASPPCIRMPNKQPAPPAHCGGADRVFHKVIVDFVAAIPQISGQRILFINKIAEYLAHGALGQECRP